MSLLAAGLALSCGSRPPHRGPERLSVAVSVPPQAFFVERIGGRRVAVTVMVPPGQSHVDYPLSPRQMAALSNADLYVLVGHPSFSFETRYIAPFLDRHPEVRTVDMAHGMDLIEEDVHEHADDSHGSHEHHGEGPGDPHVWVAPESVEKAAENIAAALAALDPIHAAEYEANFASFKADIARLDGRIRACLAGGRSRSFMVYHPSWGYLARQYGLTQIAIESEGKEPSARRLIELIERARREDVRILFVQGGFPRKSAQVIADEVGGRVVTADPQEYDWMANLESVGCAFAEASKHG